MNGDVWWISFCGNRSLYDAFWVSQISLYFLHRRAYFISFKTKSVIRVPSTPGNPGKVLELKIRFPGPWKSPGKRQFLAKVLEKSWNLINFGVFEKNIFHNFFGMTCPVKIVQSVFSFK